MGAQRHIPALQAQQSAAGPANQAVACQASVACCMFQRQRDDHCGCVWRRYVVPGNRVASILAARSSHAARCGAGVCAGVCVGRGGAVRSRCLGVDA
ncbi:hypothetical protein PHLGIDRAFT_446643 [Phlebiopsis gigantea 11061_1 CR5-6]|uniref:Uncharacterized protein n=1 Tax=Phlebiopsis gigantea (strain 11061_1 CR5-6) TaxID=745531 RepID=A0A0C3SA44_PHLG1|nr:hypothetical protein PHLGIDRAFT_446643 [Phlebiopsis gigantea 11061_1 CR5-6]